MLRLRALLITVLPLITSGTNDQQCSKHAASHHSSPVLDSMKCYNDFTSYIRCTWEMDKYMHLHVPLPETDLCTPDLSSISSSGNLHSCLFNCKVFSRHNHSFYFNVSCPAKMTTLKISQDGKVKSPENLTKTEVGDGRIVLKWSNPYNLYSSLSRALTYELQYRRHGHDWVAIEWFNRSFAEIDKHTLMPGHSYEARVRARGPVGVASNWSPSVFWTTEEESALNLQCILEEAGVTCNWQVKREHAHFLSYHLCWRNDSHNWNCKHCVPPTDLRNWTDALLDFTCSVVSSQPELLTVEVKSYRRTRGFSNPYNILPPQPKIELKDNHDGSWKLSWSKPAINEKLTLNYEVCLSSKSTPVCEVRFNVSYPDLSLDILASNLLPSTDYVVRVRALPGPGFAGQSSEWSEPKNFTSKPVSQIISFIYCLVALCVAILFIILYNALPACHRKMKVWMVSIPSPFESKILKEMSSKSPVHSPYVSIENEKTSVCIIQASDNPNICKGSISEYPLLKYNDDVDMIKSGWTSELRCYTEGSGMTDKSGMSFSGPYILCCQDSSMNSESSALSFTSLSSFDEDSKSMPGSPEQPSPTNVGYVLSPPACSSECSTTSESPPNESKEPGHTEVATDPPPAYTSSPAVMSPATFPHPSGYCLMPNMDTTVAAWVQSSAPPPEGHAEKWCNPSNEAGDEGLPAHGYVGLSQPVT